MKCFLYINRPAITNVRKFTYLGSLITLERKCVSEIEKEFEMVSNV